MRNIAEFSKAFRAQEMLVGTFVKTPDPAVFEVLARSSLDFVVLDAEHAPFDRRDINVCVLAAREGNLPVIVRVPSGDAVWLQQALDVGASGVIVPHVRTPAEAQDIVRLSHFGPGGRGYAGSTRAADYTRRNIPTHLEISAKSVIVVAQIEDNEAINHSFDIAAVNGIDGVFIGPVDLSISMGKTSPGDDNVRRAMEQVAADVRRAKKAVGTFVNNSSDIDNYRSLGLSFVLVRSDQSFMLGGADAACSEIRASQNVL